MKGPRSRLIPVTLIVLVSLSQGVGQIISDIGHEPFRDKVVITYILNGLAPQQRIEVNLYCSDDGFKGGVKSISGNGTGAYVTGNGQKTIIWDVLKDRSKLEGSISFEIRALVFNDNNTTASLNSSATAVPLTTEEKKSALYAEMSGALGSFIIEAKDLVNAFRSTNEEIFEDNITLRKITDAIIQYNQAFNTLNTERMSYEKQVLTYWKNEALYNDVRYLFDYALGELHAVNVLELNNALSSINDISTGKISGRKNEKEAREKVMGSIFQNMNQLDKRIQELERRANRILYTLSNR